MTDPLTRAAKVIDELDANLRLRVVLLAQMDDCQREYERKERLCVRICPTRFAALVRQTNMERQSA